MHSPPPSTADAHPLRAAPEAARLIPLVELQTSSAMSNLAAGESSVIFLALSLLAY